MLAGAVHIGRTGQLFGNSEEFRAVVKHCLIAQAIGQLSRIFGWFGKNIIIDKFRLNEYN